MANICPYEYLIGFMDIFQSLMVFHITFHRAAHSRWIPKPPKPRRDSNMFKLWRQFRSQLESFHLMTRNWKSFIFWNPLPVPENSSLEIGELGRTSKRLERITLELDELLDEAQTEETYTRDALQLHVGNIALDESRQSMKQGVSVGRVTLLAFIFLPLSLVTSFFGMNIQELTGNGPRLQWFLISASLFAAFTFLCWIWWIAYEHVKKFWKERYLLRLLIRVEFRINNNLDVANLTIENSTPWYSTSGAMKTRKTKIVLLDIIRVPVAGSVKAMRAWYSWRDHVHRRRDRERIEQRRFETEIIMPRQDEMSFWWSQQK